jgi:hypothetical protein
VEPESTGVKDPSTRPQLRVKNVKIAGRILEKTIRLQIAQREDGSSVELLKMRSWMLWRDPPLPKRKKKNLHKEEEPVM